ncbi:MAG: PH domain-containing protein [Nitrospinota bacterium]|nr:PH domain-containing protein [Nitrospinota bacterium]
MTILVLLAGIYIGFINPINDDLEKGARALENKVKISGKMGVPKDVQMKLQVNRKTIGKISKWAPYALMGLAAFWSVGIVLRKYGSWMELREDHIHKRRGIISKVVTEVRYDNIRSVDSRQGILERIFGIGSVLIGSAGTSGYEIAQAGLENPDQIREEIKRRRPAGDNL